MGVTGAHSRVDPAVSEPRPSARVRTSALILVLLVLVAAADRFLLLDHQSLWYDEIVSLMLAKLGLGSMLHEVARTESTPPVYYLVLWVWTRVFGTSAFAIRSLSACAGVGTVALVYLGARVRFSRGAATVAGALAATSPLSIWYSQEARAYALVTLFVAWSLYFLLRACSRPSRSSLAGWSIVSCLALGTHYFAAFVVVAEAGVLLRVYRHNLRTVLVSFVPPLAVGGALLPLALHQRSLGHAAFIATQPLGSRIEQTLSGFLFGRYAVSWAHLLPVCFAIVVGGLLSIRLLAPARVRRDALVLAAVAVFAFVMPLAVVTDSFYQRNLIVVLPPLLVLAGVAFVPRETRTAPVVAGVVVAVLLLAPTAVTARRESLQREDWRGVASIVGRVGPQQAVIAYPQFEYVALVHHRPDLEPVSSGRRTVREIVLVGRPRLETLRLPGGFRSVSDDRLGTLRIVRLRAEAPRRLDVRSLHLRSLAPFAGSGGAPADRPGQDAALLVERAGG